MCIPCVMCGACFDESVEAARALEEGRCPECGKPVPPDAISCPSCYTILPRGPAGASETSGERPRQERA